MLIVTVRRFAAASVAGLLITGGFTPGCSPPPHAVTRVRPGYVTRTNADAVVVFVHGIFGDAGSTWSNSESGESWPTLLSSDPAIAGADVYVHSFRSPAVADALSIDELVEDARVAFNHDEIFVAHRRVYFISHSMGGLVVRGLLRRYRDFAKQVPAIMFLSTPTNGSAMARAAKALSGNPQLASMADRGRGDAYLNVLQRDWLAAQFPIASHCAYETRDTFGERVVSEDSALSLCNQAVLPFDGNHIEIAKPASRSARVYAAFSDLFRASESAPRDVPTTRVRSTGVPVPREVTVACGAANEGTMDFTLPADVPPTNVVTDVAVAIAGASNLKAYDAWLSDRRERTARVGYRLVGVDGGAQRSCGVTGKAFVVATFFVENTVTDSPRVGQYIEQRTVGDNSPTVANVTGNVTIILDPSGTVQVPGIEGKSSTRPDAVTRGRSTPGPGVNQTTQGANSPAIAGVGGSVTVQVSRPKGRRGKP